MTRKPRVLFITPFGLQRRGTTLYRVFPMAVALGTAGVRTRVLIAGWDTPQASGRVSPSKNVDAIFLPFRRSLLRLGGAGLIATWLQMTCWALWFVRKWHPDVVHVIKPITVPFFFLMLTRGGGITRRLCPTTVFLDCDDLESAWHHDVPLARIWSRIGTRLEHRAWTVADHVTVASHFLKEEVIRTRVKRKAKGVVSWVPNVVTLPSPSRRGHRHARLVVPTRLLDIQADTLVEWLAAIVERVPTVNVLVVGPNQERARAFLARAEQEGIRERVAVLLFQPADAYAETLAQARVGLYAVDDTPANRAKCPRRLLDLMSMGVPTVAVDVGEARWLLEDTGALVPPRADAIAAAVSDLWSDMERRREMGERAWKRAHTQFTSEVMAERLIRTYSMTADVSSQERTGEG